MYWDWMHGSTVSQACPVRMADQFGLEWAVALASSDGHRAIHGAVGTQLVELVGKIRASQKMQSWSLEVGAPLPSVIGGLK